MFKFSGAAYRWLLELVVGPGMYQISLRCILFSPEQEQEIASRLLRVAHEQLGHNEEEEMQAFNKLCGLTEIGNSDWELACKLAEAFNQSQEWASSVLHWMAEKMQRSDGLVDHIKQVSGANWSQHPNPGRTPEQVDFIEVPEFQHLAQ